MVAIPLEPLLTQTAAFMRATVSRPSRRRAFTISLLVSVFWFGCTADASAPLPKPRPETSTSTKQSAPQKSSAAPSLPGDAPLPLAKPAYRPGWAIPSKLAKIYVPAFKLASKARWTQLAKLPRITPDPALETVLTWLRLEHPGAKTSFAEISKFLVDHPVWPRRSRLLRRAEAILDDTVPTRTKLEWFKNNPPITTTGRLKWITALNAAGDSQATASAVRDTWQLARFTRAQQRQFLKKHRSVLDPDSNWRRMDRFLWLGATGAARAMLPLVAPARRRLAEARLRLRGFSGGIDAAIKRVPLTLQSDPGLIYERLRWRHRKGLKAEALEMLWDIPQSPTFRPLWWNERSRQVRYALDAGRHEDAYLLAASHIQRSGASFAEAQWHAGWVALRFRDKPDEAARYFTGMHKAVKTPISRARASYWAGRALEAAGGTIAARRWYGLAARHHTTFYGQLASTKIPSSITRLPSTPTPFAAIKTGPETRELVSAAVALSEIGQDKMTRLFFRTAARGTTVRDEAVWIASSARALGYLDLGVYTARRAARSGHILTEAGYPVIKVPSEDGPEPALTLAVIRQESGFDEKARSPVGALGLMQLMPATARNVARGLKVRYGRGRLTTDPAYNMRLGTRYLKKQLERFGGEYALALAAYNAGPHRVKRWLKERGDPRTPGVDMIDWIERIPFAETRNYVQRVLESMQVYRLRLGSPRTGWRMSSNPDGAGACLNGSTSGGCARAQTAKLQ
jgi:soluble lytic murein transglycosylase